jgi:hypothetical protein
MRLRWAAFGTGLAVLLAVACDNSTVVSGGEGAAGAAAPVCGPDSVGLQGSLEGEDVAESYAYIDRGFRGPQYKAFFQTKGKVLLVGDAGIGTTGGTTAARGVFRMPDEGPAPGLWLCAGDGSNVTFDKDGDPDRTAFTLSSLSRLGTCPGTPVSGEITACLSSDPAFCPTGTTFEGTLGDTTFDFGNFVSGWGGAILVYEIFLENGAVIALDIQQDTVLSGVLRMPPDGADADAIYCLGGGSMIPGGGNSIQITVGGLSRLGTCAGATPIQGALTGCAP